MSLPRSGVHDQGGVAAVEDAHLPQKVRPDIRGEHDLRVPQERRQARQCIGFDVLEIGGGVERLHIEAFRRAPCQALGSPILQLLLHQRWPIVDFDLLAHGSANSISREG